MTFKRVSYCQSCIETGRDLKLTTINGRAYWLCEQCHSPLPRHAYDNKASAHAGVTTEPTQGNGTHDQ